MQLGEWMYNDIEMQEEMIANTIAQQRTKMETYATLRKHNLPIPPDLKQEIEGDENLAYSSGYLSGFRGSEWWSPERMRGTDAWKMGYADGYGDAHSE